MDKGMDKVFIYVGSGLGVSGLPNEISEQDARAAGLLTILQAAVKNGNYQLKEAKKASGGK